jgi:hypothetical protein
MAETVHFLDIERGIFTNQPTFHARPENEAPFGFIEADPVFAVMYSSGCMQSCPRVKFVPAICEPLTNGLARPVGQQCCR